MSSADGLLRSVQDELGKIKNSVLQIIIQRLPKKWRPRFLRFIAIILFVTFVVQVAVGIVGVLRSIYYANKCNTANNFERPLWKTGSMRVISWDEDTGEPDLYGAKQAEPYQSLMVYEIPCQLPLVATVSATIHSPSSIGMVFEFDGVLQVILGDGDLRSIRYKTDTLGSRKMGWRYVIDEDKGTPLTHWLPNGEKITVGTQVDWTISFHSNEEKIEAQVSLSYQLRNGWYQTQVFPWVQIGVQSYNPIQNVGRFIRVGINDQLYKGTQSAIRFRHFSIRSVWSN